MREKWRTKNTLSSVYAQKQRDFSNIHNDGMMATVMHARESGNRFDRVKEREGKGRILDQVNENDQR